MSEEIHTQEGREELFNLYMQAQISAIVFGIRAGIAENANDWVERFGEPFRMVMQGELEIPRDMDWNELKSVIDDLTRQTNKLINKVA